MDTGLKRALQVSASAHLLLAVLLCLNLNLFDKNEVIIVPLYSSTDAPLQATMIENPKIKEAEKPQNRKEQPKKEPPKEEPKKEEPKKEEPKKEEPKKEEPKKEEVKESKTPLFLQAGSFSTAQDADNQKAKLAFMGVEAVIQQVMIQDKTFYRVRVGPYTKIDELNKVRAELAKSGIEAQLAK